MIKTRRNSLNSEPAHGRQTTIARPLRAPHSRYGVKVLRDFPEMKVWVVHNKTVPVEILRLLASDAAVEIRFQVATKNKLPTDLMELLANDSDESVRMRIAYNKNVAEKILEQLGGDPSPAVSAVARQRLLAMKQK